MRRATGSFPALDDRGKLYRIIIYTTFIERPMLNGPPARIDGVKEFALTDGSPVNRMDTGQYEIVATGRVLRSDAPNAP
jgi:hypothetical protein